MMAVEQASRARRLARRGLVLLGAGALVAATNLSGIGAPEPAFTALNTSERLSSPSRSLPDRLEVQSGVTAGSSADPFLRLATGDAEAEAAGDGPVCISSPLAPGTFRISSNYGMRTNPITGGHGLHAGVDLAAALGTPIHAVADGTVSYTGKGRAGRSSELVIIDHEVDGVRFSSWYVHMYPTGVFVKAGQKVRAGERIAEVGSNGFSTGPHLHLEIHTALGGTGGTGKSLGRLLSAAAGTPSPSPSDSPSPTQSPSPTESPSESPSPSESEPPTDEEGVEEVEEPGEETEEDPAAPGEEGGEESEESDLEEETPEADKVEDIEIEEDDDEGKNDHTIDDTVSGDTGRFDPSSLGVLHDPLPFLRELGYGLAAPSSCLAD